MSYKTIIIFFLLFAYQPVFADISPDYQKRIIGGSIVNFSTNSTSDINEWSWVVALIDQNNNHFCGASLIDSQWLMTAAHCLYDYSGQNASNLKITALFKQSDLLKTDEDTITREVISTIIHPDYSYSSDNNDIALLQLDSPIVDIPPVSVPGQYFNAPIRSSWEPATVLGWGTTQRYQNTLLRQAQLPIADFQDCSDNYKEYGIDITLNMICAGFEQGGIDACTGDSGGPLVIHHEGGAGWKQIGIVSFGIGCAEADFFGVYTRVSRYNNFIQSHVCKDSSSAPRLSVQKNITKQQLTLTIETASNKKIDDVTGYRIYYAPYPDATPLLHYDFVDSNSVTLGPVPKDVKFYMIAQSLQNNCSSNFSNLITTPAF
ncbi:MAG: serine protease [gamma proteobacterium symbiont of Taylorina sp.]|nr:serine protease [gamma proteobacterium symbiont of Taylorina sp.]